MPPDRREISVDHCETSGGASLYPPAGACQFRTMETTIDARTGGCPALRPQLSERNSWIELGSVQGMLFILAADQVGPS